MQTDDTISVLFVGLAPSKMSATNNKKSYLKNEEGYYKDGRLQKKSSYPTPMSLFVHETFSPAKHKDIGMGYELFFHLIFKICHLYIPLPFVEMIFI